MDIRTHTLARALSLLLSCMGLVLYPSADATLTEIPGCDFMTYLVQKKPSVRVNNFISDDRY
jgi:hypothetical protein